MADPEKGGERGKFPSNPKREIFEIKCNKQSKPAKKGNFSPKFWAKQRKQSNNIFLNFKLHPPICWKNSTQFCEVFLATKKIIKFKVHNEFRQMIHQFWFDIFWYFFSENLNNSFFFRSYFYFLLNLIFFLLRQGRFDRK